MKILLPRTNIVFIFLFLIAFNNHYVCAQVPVFNDVSTQSGIVDINQHTNLFGSGASVADFDKDGDLDFFIGTEKGEPSQLYQNNGSGVFQNIANQVGLTSEIRVRASLWLDYDNDKRLDLFVIGDCFEELPACSNQIVMQLFKQNSNGTFTESSRDAGLDFGGKYDATTNQKAIGGIVSGDINNDEFLDIFISIYGAEMTLFVNNGDGTFSDASTSSNLGNGSKFAWQPMLYDFNKDGWEDIYCNMDYAANELWLNNGDGTFNEVGNSVGAGHSFNEMGLTIGDYDNDGDMDLYATNISRNESGVLRHNMLLENQIEATDQLGFNETSNANGVGASGWDWGTTFFDANNDGWLDLAATNGWTPANWGSDQSKLWINQGDGTFQDASTSASFNDQWDATSLVSFDMDRDGDQDLLQTLKINGNDKKPARLYENQLNTTATPGNYIVVKPRMNGNNHFAIGAVVKISYNTNSCMRPITAGTSFYGQEPAEAFFGLSNNTVIDELRIDWPDNTTTILQDVAANQVLTVTNETALSVVDFENSISVKSYPNPTKDKLYVQLDHHQIERMTLFTLLGQSILDKPMDSTNESVLDLSDLESGGYILRVTLTNSFEKVYLRVLKN